LGSGLGYAWIILAVAFFRELLGSGSIFDFKVFEAIGWSAEGWVGSNFPTNGLMVSPVGAFIILGLIIWVQRARNGYVEND
jgi:Na+-transporting NADH:ubiquinone oxidoreductase subunit D